MKIADHLTLESLENALRRQGIGQVFVLLLERKDGDVTLVDYGFRSLTELAALIAIKQERAEGGRR